LTLYYTESPNKVISRRVRYQWLTPVISATWEEEIRRTEVEDNPGK
jgi:hypothetical protein